MNESVQGGRFLVTPVGDVDSCIPEELSSEFVQLRQMAQDFVEGEVLPRDAEIEAQTPGVMATLLKKAGELGLLMVEVPQECGGLGLGKVAATAVAEGSAAQGSFIVALMCHTGIAMLPLLYYGNPQQQQKYLSKLATGAMVGSYALTEANAGSDALAGRMKATKTPDGKFYLLNGEKQFITNGGFADLYTVFAKVDGDKFSAFLVERTMPGVSHGPEEKKMGVHGSSTVPLILQDAKVPVDNLLGEIGKGHKIAFQTLNVGRWKLAAGAVGGGKRIIETVGRDGKERRQFGKTLAEFELTKQKLAEMAMRTFLLESIVYRYAGDVDQANSHVSATAPDVYRQWAAITEELAIEASICKVFGSESAFALADEAVQLFGGYGYIRDYRAERYLRDARIHRIWEGTNEINRFLIPGTLMKRMAKGGIDFLGELTTILEQFRTGFPVVDANAPLAYWQNQVNQLKKLVIYVGGVGVNVFGPEMQEHQQFLYDLAELIIAAYVADSGLARVLKIIKRAPDQAMIPTQLVTSYLVKRLPELKVLALQCLADVAAGDEKTFQPYRKAMERFFGDEPCDLRTIRNCIADAVLAHGGYPSISHS